MSEDQRFQINKTHSCLIKSDVYKNVVENMEAIYIP